MKVRTFKSFLLVALVMVLFAMKPAQSFAQDREFTNPKQALTEAERLDVLVRNLYDQGKFEQAVHIAEKSLAIKETVLGPDHPDTGASIGGLAVLYQSQGAYAKAEPLYLRALAIDETALGPYHLDTGTSVNNLAELYQAQGVYIKAEPLYLRALAIKESTLEPDHPDIATSLNNLAVLYYDQGLYTKAEANFQRALAIGLRVFCEA